MSYLHYLMCLCVFVVLTPLSFAVPQSKIIGGSPSMQPYSWMVSIQDETGHFCGGVLIHEHFVLTAAHCLEDVQASNLSLLIGELNRHPSAAIVLEEADWYIKHSEYDDQSLTRDIAIIKLKKASNKKPINIIGSLSGVGQNDPLTVMGWGLTKEGDLESSPSELREVAVKFQSDSICKTSYSEVEDNYWEYSFCAGELSGERDSCSGDSGGPIVIKTENGLELAGVVSWGFGCGVPEFYGVYTEVPAFIPWVEQRINGLSIVGNEKVGFLGYSRTKSEKLTLINSSLEALAIDQYDIKEADSGSFQIDSNNWLFDQVIPAKSQCHFTMDAYGVSAGEKNAQLIVSSGDVKIAHNLNSKVLMSLDVPAANLPWPIFSGTKTQGNNPETEHSEPWYGLSLGGDGVVLSSGNISAHERSVLLTYLNGPELGEERYLRFDAKVDAEFPDGLYPFVNERMAFPVSLDPLLPHVLQQAGSLDRWFSYQVPLAVGVNHLMFIYLKDGEKSRGRDRALLKNPRICISVEQSDDECSTAEAFYANQSIKLQDDYPKGVRLSDVCMPVDWQPIKTSAAEQKIEPIAAKKSGSGSLSLILLLFLVSLTRTKVFKK